MSIKTSNKILPDLSKLELLEGTNYRRWSQKLLIFFEQLEVDYVLTTNLPSSDPPTTTSTSSNPGSSMGPSTTFDFADQVKKDQVIDPEKYAKDNKTVRGHLLNHMSDPMFDLFVVQKSAKDIWSTLESHHGTNVLLANVLSEGMKMCEILQANVLLEKFPPSWNHYRNHLKHKKKDLKLQELISHMRTEEANRLKDKKGRPSQKPTPQANLAEQNSEIIATIVEANLIENKTDWILDTGASRNFCTNHELLHDYENTTDGECMFMGNSATAGVIGKEKVILKLTSEKTLSLSNVLYVSSLRRNLVSGSLLNRTGLKIVLEGDKVVLTKNGDFVGKGYLSNGLFVLNTISMNANASSSAYVIESANLWHGRLGHVNFASIRKLKDLRLINTSESHETGKCPICVESKFHKKPFKPVKYRTTDLSGDASKVPFPALKKSTVGSKTFDYIIIGYAQNSAAYRFMCLNDKTINESRDAEFFEHVFPLKQSLYAPSLSKRMHDPENPSIVSEIPVSETVDTSNLRCELELRRSKRQRTEKSFGQDFLSTFIVERRDEIDRNFTNLYLIDEDPKTYQEALNSVDLSMWKEAINSELDSLVMNHTWDLVDLPMENKPIRCKWIFKRKTKPNGSIERYKARLVVVGYTQKQGIDYFDTYSPVTKITTIRALNPVN
ncbi:ty1-copia retrotransposon protein [Cucumis melo var. makuwa]|uniref:Ty1-copia retrotransposon protein n=1 Tax=Cucumis melo var. makuwa TaxID=1194695 RepID=A0A5A7TFH9_CUCMM|nr:ty1-copia retrotransposon protein [Cucumis melo var. makuwa]TYK18022.1 ty1-copia retrotransposon protein [Cucumis melo var. makuwa]